MERFGRYTRTLNAGLNIVVPFIDSIRNRIDLREQVVPFPPQPVITQDNLVVNIDTVIYYQVTDARAATYEDRQLHPGDRAAHRHHAPQHHRRHGPGADPDLPRGDQRGQLRGVLDEATGKWGIRVNRVELKAIEPPHLHPGLDGEADARRPGQARRDPQRRGCHGSREILRAEGEKQSAILRAEGEAKAARPARRGRGPGAIRTVFEAIHAGDPDQKLLAYQYLQMLPKIAEGDANKLWIMPSEIGDALRGISGALGGDSRSWATTRTRSGVDPGLEDDAFADTTLEDPAKALAEARGQAGQASAEATEHASRSGTADRSRPPDPTAGMTPPSAPEAGAPVDPRRLRRGAGDEAEAMPGQPSGRTYGQPAPGQPLAAAAQALTHLTGGTRSPSPRVTGCRSPTPCSSCSRASCAGTINTIVGSGTLMTFPVLLLPRVPGAWSANVSNNIGLVAGGVTGA